MNEKLMNSRHILFFNSQRSFSFLLGCRNVNCFLNRSFRATLRFGRFYKQTSYSITNNCFLWHTRFLIFTDMGLNKLQIMMVEFNQPATCGHKMLKHHRCSLLHMPLGDFYGEQYPLDFDAKNRD